MSANPKAGLELSADAAAASNEAARWSVLEMTLEDVREVERIERAVYAYPWSAGNFRDSLSAGYRCLVCRLDGALAGYAVQMYVIDEAHLLNITIAPARQQRGHGTRLMRWLMQEARSRNMTTLFLEVRPSNTGAQTLYSRMGFAQVAVRRDYYPAPNGREDALIFKTQL
jgi:ribosomal-protein-alanine N-acetyltransferase